MVGEVTATDVTRMVYQEQSEETIVRFALLFFILLPMFVMRSARMVAWIAVGKLSEVWLCWAFD